MKRSIGTPRRSSCSAGSFRVKAVSPEPFERSTRLTRGDGVIQLLDLESDEEVEVEKVIEEDERVGEVLDVTAMLLPCDICTRKFLKSRLEKHQSICAKSKTRKTYDVQAARVHGTDLEKYVKRRLISETGTFPCNIEVKKPLDWRVKHDAFRNMVVSSRQPGPTPREVIEPNPDYVQCPSCERRFNEEAGKRHIPSCKERAAKRAMDRPSIRPPPRPPARLPKSVPRRTSLSNRF